MTRSRRITPHEWIQDYFSPLVSVLCSPEVHSVCGKNNLTLTELLQPFSKLMADVAFKDPADGANHSLSGFCVTFQDFSKDPSRMVNQKLLSDLVAATPDEPTISRDFPGGLQLEAPGFTPWFDTWMKLYIQSIPAVEHEFSRHHVGVLLAVSSSETAPVDQLRVLTEQSRRHLVEKPMTYPTFVTSGGNPATSLLKYYVLVHDVYEGGSEERAQEIFTQMQVAFGSSNCHFLQVNSRNALVDNDGGDGSGGGGGTNAAAAAANPALVDYWLGHSHRFCNVETRREGMGMTVINTAAAANMSGGPSSHLSHQGSVENHKEEVSHQVPNDMDHPLAAMEQPDSPSPPPPASTISSKLCPVTNTNIAANLTSNDVDRIRILIREFCVKALLPHLERQMRTLHETLTNRKTRSLFSGAKGWFGQKKAGAAAGTSVVYSKEAPELQMRKLGDLYFMMRLYKNAYTWFHTCKKDFHNDEAWNYYSGAAEMTALAQFMQNDSTKKYPAHYMDDCITKYLQVCQMPEFAVRATLFDALNLKHLGRFQDAANRFIKMTNESKDMRSSLLFEQASYCYLLSTPPSIRKYAFHIILAGYRFAKAGQKRHSSRAYRQGFQVYQDHSWALSEDHILYNLGHQSLLLKDYSAAAALFNQLLSMAHPNPNALQQMCHLREFFIVHHHHQKEDKKAGVVTIPKFHEQLCVLDLSGGGLPYEDLAGMNAGLVWQNLERVVVERISGQEMLVMTRTNQNLFTPVSCNRLRPHAAVGERIRIMLPVENKFQTTLVMKKVHLLWRFKPEGGGEDDDDASSSISNEGGGGGGDGNLERFVLTKSVDLVTTEKSSTTNIELELIPLQPGELFVTGVEYGVKAQFPQAESTDYTIRGKQHFTVQGPRLKATKEHKTSVVYGQDHRLQIQVREEQPRLSVDLKLPDTIFQGELRSLDLTLNNVGKVPMGKSLYLVLNRPGLLSLNSGGDQRSATSASSTSLYEFPIIVDPLLTDVKEDGESLQTPLDFLPLALPGSVEPGGSVKLSLWIRGPQDKLGTDNVQLVFYYQGNTAAAISAKKTTKKKKQLDYRMLPLSHAIKVLPSVTASALSSEPCKLSNSPGQSVVVHVSNASKEKHKALDNLLITQISLVSHHSKLSDFQSKNENRPVGKTDALSLSVQMTQAVQATAAATTATTTSSICYFSSIVCKNISPYVVQSPPYLDFLKPGFTFSSSKAHPVLAQDLFVVFWSSGGGGDGIGQGAITGQTIVPLKQQTKPDEADRGASTISIVPKTTRPCHVKLEVGEIQEHDFVTSRLCPVSCQLMVTNPDKTSESKLVLEVDEDGCGEGVSVLGCVDAEVILGPGEQRQFRFSIVVMSPGLYQCRGLRLQMIGTTEKTVNLVPLEICFIVKQS